MFQSRSVPAYGCFLTVLQFYIVDLGALIFEVAAGAFGSLMMEDLGKSRCLFSGACFLTPSLTGIKRFRVIGFLAYKSAKRNLNSIVQYQGCVAWLGKDDVDKEIRKRQTGLTVKCQCIAQGRKLTLMVCVSTIQSVLYIVIVWGRHVRWFIARGWLRRVRLDTISGSVTS